MKYLMSAEWWKAAGIRAVKTMCQTGAALVVTQVIIPGLSEPPVRTLRATIPECRMSSEDRF